MEGVYAEAARIVDLELARGPGVPRLMFKEFDISQETLCLQEAQTASFRTSVSSRFPDAILSLAADDLPLDDQGNMVPSLKLVNFDKGNSRDLYVERAFFLDLFDSFHLDRYGLYLYLTGTHGLHMLDCTRPGSNGNRMLRFYLHHHDHILLWSYDCHTHCTRAISIHAYSNKTHHHIALFESIIQHQAMLAKGNPLFLAFASAAHGYLHQWELFAGDPRMWDLLNADNDMGLLEAREMELDPRASELLETLSGRCLKNGYIISQTREKLMALILSRDILDKLGDPSFWSIVQCALRTDGERQGLDTVQAEMLRAATFVRSQIGSRILHFEYVQAEARQNLEMTMARVQRTDALLNKTDSSSMKVIAIMTMAFLPATFFATMFALPSLNANNGPQTFPDSSISIQPDFWIYLVFSLPATAIVFLLWAVWTNKFSRRGVLFKMVRKCCEPVYWFIFRLFMIARTFRLWRERGREKNEMPVVPV